MARRWRSGRAASACRSAAARSRACRRQLRAGCLVGELGHRVAAELAAAAQAVDAEVARHPVEPGGERRAVGLPVGRDLPEPQHRLLRHVLGLRHLAEHPPRQREDARRVPRGQRARGGLVPVGVAARAGRRRKAPPRRRGWSSSLRLWPFLAPPSPVERAARARKHGRAPLPSSAVLRRFAARRAGGRPSPPGRALAVVAAVALALPPRRASRMASASACEIAASRSVSAKARRKFTRCPATSAMATWPVSVAPIIASSRSAKASAGSGAKRFEEPAVRPRHRGDDLGAVQRAVAVGVGAGKPLAGAGDQLGAAERAVAVGVDGGESRGRRAWPIIGPAGGPSGGPAWAAAMPAAAMPPSRARGGGEPGDACHLASSLAW